MNRGPSSTARPEAFPGAQMVTMRLGHFVGAANTLGMVPALVPRLRTRLRTRLVPWLAGGRARLPVADTDLGEAFALAATAEHLDDYESFNIVGPTVPTARGVIEFIADETGSPRPAFSVPYAAGYAFAWLMETLHPVLPGPAPFLIATTGHVTARRYGRHADDQWTVDELLHLARNAPAKPHQRSVALPRSCRE